MFIFTLCFVFFFFFKQKTAYEMRISDGSSDVCSSDLLCLALPLYVAAIYQSDWRFLMALLFAATVCLYAFLPTIMTVTQALVEPRMRASAAALHSFGQTVAGLGIGSVLLGYLRDRLADSNFAGDYAAICIAAKQGQAPGACAEAAATGLQHAMLAVDR